MFVLLYSHTIREIASFISWVCHAGIWVLQYITLYTIPDKIINMAAKNILTEVAEHLRIYPYTVRRLAREGKLPGFKVGGQ